MAQSNNITIKFKSSGAPALKAAITALANEQERLNGKFKGYVKGADAANKKGRLLNNAFATMRSKLLLVNFAMALGVRQLIGFAKEATKVESMSRAFSTLAGATENSAVALDKLKSATNNTMSEFDLFQQANNAMILGVSKNSDEMAEMFDVAQRLGRALGRDTKSSVESLITGIGRQSRLMLDNIGIIVKADEAYEAYADRLGTTADKLSDSDKKTAFLEATMESARAKVALLGAETETAQDSFDRLTASLQDGANIIGASLAPSLATAADGLSTFMNNLGKSTLKIALEQLQQMNVAAKSLIELKTMVLFEESDKGLKSTRLELENLKRDAESLFPEITKMFTLDWKAILNIALARQSINSVGADFTALGGSTSELTERMVELNMGEAEARGMLKELGAELKSVDVASQLYSGTLTEETQKTFDQFTVLTKLVAAYDQEDKIISDLQKSIEGLNEVSEEATIITKNYSEGIGATNTNTAFFLTLLDKTKAGRLAEKEATLLALESHMELMGVDENLLLLHAQLEQQIYKLSGAKKADADATKILNDERQKALSILGDAQTNMISLLVTEQEHLDAKEQLAIAQAELLFSGNEMEAQLFNAKETIKEHYDNLEDERIVRQKAQYIKKLEDSSIFYSASIAGYDQFVSSLTDMDMDGKTRREVIWDATRSALISFMGDYLKELIISKIAQEGVATAGQTAAIASSVVTGASIAAAYSSAAALASLASFGANAIPAAAGIASTKALTLSLASMEQGGVVGGRRHSQGGTIIEAEQGEFVMSRNAVDSVGLEAMNRINSGGGSGAVSINFTGNVMSQDFIEDEAIPMIKEAIRRGADIGVA